MKENARSPNLMMALIGGKIETSDVSDGVFDSSDSQTEGSLSANQTGETSNGETTTVETTTVEETVASKIIVENTPYEPGIYEQMDDFDVPDEAIGKIGVYSDSKLIQSAVEGIISLKRAREQLVHSVKDGV